MPTTSNFGWTTPADTDLVKDGAAAIRTLGNGIDTSLVDLKGGTTGQVLSKNSNTDLDFTWVAQDDSDAIQNAIVDAKGDLISATAADTPARLASSAVNGDVLTVDTSTATGLKWATPSAGAFTLISSTTLNGTPTITLSNIPQTYVNLVIIIRSFIPATDNRRLGMRFNADSNANRHKALYTNATENDGGSGTTSFVSSSVDILSGPMDNATGTNFGYCEIYDYTNTSTWKMARAASVSADGGTPTNIRWQNSTYAYNQTGAITSLSFLPLSDGNMTSGTLLLYGVK